MHLARRPARTSAARSMRQRQRGRAAPMLVSRPGILLRESGDCHWISGWIGRDDAERLIHGLRGFHEGSRSWRASGLNARRRAIHRSFSATDRGASGLFNPSACGCGSHCGAPLSISARQPNLCNPCHPWMTPSSSSNKICVIPTGRFGTAPAVPRPHPRSGPAPSGCRPPAPDSGAAARIAPCCWSRRVPAALPAGRPSG